MKEAKRSFLVDSPERKQLLMEYTFSSIPHTKTLGIELISLERNKAICRLPYKEEFVGNIENGALHTGVQMSLIDTTAGLAVFGALPKVESVATLDLRLDCFKPSTRNMAIYAQAECYRLTKTVAFVRGSIYHDTLNDPITSCVATFFRTGNPAKIEKDTGRWQ